MPVSLSQEKKDQIAQDFIDIFQTRYGPSWQSMLTKKLTPSPVYQIAEQRDVSVSTVRKIRTQLLATGHILLFIKLISEPFSSS